EHIIHLSDLRLEGFRLGLKEQGVALAEEHVSRAPFSREGILQQAEGLLGLPNPPDAVFTYSDLHAAHFLRAARARGLRVPQDLSVIGFDGTDLSDYLELTTVDQGLDESGRLAAEMLMSRIADHGRPLQNTRLQLTVIERGTT
ncbi:MAG TPA: substrate-binding domain-containing protein, partial [Spirochaetia bacterium]|nr:substrate-binding domain-containing protein [Spirochaetia bacterium]